jgi:hypothetical protein
MNSSSPLPLRRSRAPRQCRRSSPGQRRHSRRKDATDSRLRSRAARSWSELRRYATQGAGAAGSWSDLQRSTTQGAVAAGSWSQLRCKPPAEPCLLSFESFFSLLCFPSSALHFFIGVLLSLEGCPWGTTSCRAPVWRSLLRYLQVNMIMFCYVILH